LTKHTGLTNGAYVFSNDAVTEAKTFI